MKKLPLYFFLVLIFCNITFAQSSLPECEGNDENISKYSRKHFSKMRKWTNCHGTAMGPKGQKYIGEFYDGEFHGQGTFTYGRNAIRHGYVLEGQWKNDVCHGQIITTYPDGRKFKGTWIDNVAQDDWDQIFD